MRLLALDASSKSIGYVLWNGTCVLAHGTVHLSGKTLYARIVVAYHVACTLLATHTPYDVAIEAPAHHTHALAMIAQQRVMGAILLAVASSGLPVVEVPPTKAKLALAGKGNADKTMMQLAARAYLTPGFDEHAADALGVALAAQKEHAR